MDGAWFRAVSFSRQGCPIRLMTNSDVSDGPFPGGNAPSARGPNLALPSQPLKMPPS